MNKYKLTLRAHLDTAQIDSIVASVQQVFAEAGVKANIKLAPMGDTKAQTAAATKARLGKN